MADIALKWNGTIADIDFGELDINSDTSLESAILISLFTDKRVEGQRGTWFDSYEAELGNEELGSRLWLLDREKRVSEIPVRANEYAKEALRWLIQDGIVKSIQVDSYLDGQNLLAIPITVTKPDGIKTNFKFDLVWEALKK
jgi:phage gp46-like protein